MKILIYNTILPINISKYSLHKNIFKIFNKNFLNFEKY